MGKQTPLLCQFVQQQVMPVTPTSCRDTLRDCRFFALATRRAPTGLYGTNGRLYRLAAKPLRRS